VDGFLELTEPRQSTERFRRWAAISLVAAALERKVWISVRGRTTYPHLFIILVGPAGAGKGEAMDEIAGLFGNLTEHCLAPSSMSAASFTDALNAAVRTPAGSILPQAQFNSLYILCRELGMLLPAYDPAFMNTLTDVFDAKRQRQTRRGNSANGRIDFTIERPQVNILAATTPSYLNNFLPASAWGEGFISRVMLVYSGSAKPKSLLDGYDRDERLYRDLVSDLRVMGAKYGQLRFEPDTLRALNEWHLSGGEPVPSHPRLFSYVERRTAHLLKLCIIATAARGTNQFLIERQDLDTALAWLLEAEEAMPEIFKASSGPDGQLINDCWHFVYTTTQREHKPLLEDRLYAYLKDKAPSYAVERIVTVMVKSKVLLTSTDYSGRTIYTPAPKAAASRH
jgi:hypothetical protein